MRLAESVAKLRLSETVSKKDAKQAVDLLHYCLRQVALDEETGQIDIDRIATDIPATQRNKIVVIKDIISDLENKIGKTIPLDDIMASARDRGINESDAEEVIQKLKRAGDLFEPRHGFVSRI